MSDRVEKEMPLGWETARLGDVLHLVRGIAFPKDAKADSPSIERIACLRTANIQQEVEWNDLWYIPRSFVRRSEQFVLPGDILISTANSLNLVGKVALVKSTPCDSTLGAFIALMRVRGGIEPKFIYFQLASADVQSLIRKGASTTTNISNISVSKLAELPIAIAPRREQRRIIKEIEKHLSDLDAGVAALKRVQANLKRYRASVLKAACEGRLVAIEAELARAERRDYEPADKLLEHILKDRRAKWEADQLARMKAAGGAPKSESWRAKYPEPDRIDCSRLPSLPEGWCWASVDMVGDVLLGRQRAPQYLTGRFSRPYLRVANVKDDALDFSDIESMDFDEEHFAKYSLRSGDILVSEGQSPELVGQSAIYRGGIEALCFQKTLHRFRPVVSGPKSEFAQIVFRSHVKSGVFRRLASITTNIAHLTLEKFKAAPFPLPPKAEQQRIVVEVERLLSIANAVERAIVAQIARAGRLRQTILKRAFEGKLVPQDPSDEPASVLLDRIRQERASSTDKPSPGQISLDLEKPKKPRASRRRSAS